VPHRAPRTRRGASRLVLGLLFAALLAAFAVGLWGTIIRPAAYEIRGEVVARPQPSLLLVRHADVPALGMTAMELMAVVAEPAQVDAAEVRPGDRVRLAVRQRGDDLVLLRIEKLP
jgi:hypothetical protein